MGVSHSVLRTSFIMKLLLASLLVTSVFGQDCPEVVPADCNYETELMCDMGYDYSNPMGCWLGSYCTPMKMPDSNGDNTCYAMCPMYCMENQISCHNGYSSEGCDNGNYCMDSMTADKNGDMTCPTICPVMCSADQISCHNGYSSEGCDSGNYCMDSMTADNNGDMTCPTMCPAMCSADQISCHNGYSPEGCDYGNYCMDASYDNGDQGTCSHFCPAVCDWETETTQDMGIDANGCWLGSFCVPMDYTSSIYTRSGKTGKGNGKGKGKRGKGKKTNKKGK